MQREHAGVRWEIQPDFAPFLESVLQSPGEIVKQSPVKSVTRHQLGERTFYLKRYLHSAVPFRSWKYYCKRTPAREEWLLAQLLDARQIPIVRHLALGERHTWAGIQESLLLTEGFSGTTLNLNPTVPSEAVLQFVELLHDRGVIQEDMHPGNILVRVKPLELRLVDLDGIRVVDSLSAAERQKNLAVLRMTIALPVPPEVEALSRTLRRAVLQTRSYRCLRRNRDFAPLDAGGLRWQLRLPFLEQRPTIQSVLADPDAFLTRARLLKAGRTATVGAADGLVLKRFNFRKLENLLKDLFRRSRARRAFRAAYHLELAGIPTARSVAIASRRALGFLLRSYLLMEEIAGAVDLGQLLRRGPPDLPLIRQTAGLIGRLHEEGFSHRDLKESNLVRGTNGLLYLIDLDALRFEAEIPEHRAALDLGRLARGMEKYPNVKPSHRLVFLLLYCRARGLRHVPRRC